MKWSSLSCFMSPTVHIPPWSLGVQGNVYGIIFFFLGDFYSHPPEKCKLTLLSSSLPIPLTFSLIPSPSSFMTPPPPFLPSFFITIQTPNLPPINPSSFDSSKDWTWDWYFFFTSMEAWFCFLFLKIIMESWFCWCLDFYT